MLRDARQPRFIETRHRRGYQFVAALSAPSPAHGADSSSSTPDISAIAVLPFDNLSEDKANAYFAEGVQDEILTRLAKVADLKVIARGAKLQD